jgi:hypothetical protein
LPATASAQSGDAPAAAQQDPETKYNELVKAWNKAFAEWREKAVAAYQEAQEAGRPEPEIVRNPPSKEFVERAAAAALEYAGEDTAIPFHVFVLRYASREVEAVATALKTLTMDHAASADIGKALSLECLSRAARMRLDGEVMDLLAEVVEFHEVAECKAKALLVRGSLLLQQAGADDAAKRAAGVKDLEQVAKVTADEDLRAQAEDALFEIRHLQVGCEAPDIAGLDIDGVAFKLSDYRGKVILLDFWGFW